MMGQCRSKGLYEEAVIAVTMQYKFHLEKLFRMELVHLKCCNARLALHSATVEDVITAAVYIKDNRLVLPP